MTKKLIALAIAALVLYCAAISLYKTWEAEKKRREREKEAEKADAESADGTAEE